MVISLYKAKKNNLAGSLTPGLQRRGVVFKKPLKLNEYI